MIYHPEEYKIADKAMQPFIDEQEIHDFLTQTTVSDERLKQVIQKSMDKNRLSLEETAVLIKATAPHQVELIKKSAKALKEQIYGERIVLFAPLYIGNLCTNNCQYCGFRVTNKNQVRKTLAPEDIHREVKTLEDSGHKRLILVYGEHPIYNADFIADTVREVYKAKSGKSGEIRRVNINAAPLTIEGFRKVKEAGIGTYQIFQETYHPETYKKVHLGGQKRHFENRLVALDRAQEAGIDDVGIGALFGLYDWQYELLALVRHVNHFEKVYHIGPHTISFPRIQNASAIDVDLKHKVSDADFTRLVAILRLAVPYTGLILTAREPRHIRDEVLTYGVSQIDGGTNIQMEGYSKTNGSTQNLETEQFEIMDTRSLAEIIEELIDTDYLPSFCTACYRLGRTGEHFMEFSVPGFIKRYCGPNAILTLAEYLEDYATPDIKKRGYDSIYRKIDSGELYNTKILRQRLEKIKQGERDLYF